jgi:O-antigen/teichoic acid export membrane protein
MTMTGAIVGFVVKHHNILATGSTRGRMRLVTRFFPGLEASTDQGRRDVRALMTSIAGISYRIVDASIKLLTIPLATHLLGVEKYGIWLTASSILSLLMVSDFGIGSGLINLVGGSATRGDVRSVRSYTATAYVAFAALALFLIIAVTCIAKSSVLPHWVGVKDNSVLVSQSRQLFVIMGCLVAGSASLNVVNFFASALQEGFFAHAAQIGASLIALFCILHLHSSSMEHFALASSLPILCAYLALSIYIYGFRHRAMAPDFRAVNFASFRVIWHDSSRLLVAQIADTVIAFTSNVLVASQLGAAVVPEVSVSLQVMMIFNFVSCMFILPLWPAYVEAGVREDWTWIKTALWRGVVRSVGAVALGCLCYTLIYRVFIHTWSRVLPIPPLGFVIALDVWFLVYVWNKNFMVLLNALGFTSVRAWVAPVSAAVFIATAAALLAKIGIIAIPVAGIASALVEASITTAKGLSLLTNRQMRLSITPEVNFAPEG